MSDPIARPKRRLECVGKSSKVPLKDPAGVKAGLQGSGDPAVNKFAHSPQIHLKPTPFKPQCSALCEGKGSSVGQPKGNIIRSEACYASLASGAAHRTERLPTPPVPVEENFAEEKTAGAGNVGRVCKPAHQEVHYQGQPKCSPKQSTSKAQSGDEECGEDEEAQSGDEECGEDEIRAPIELLAEFLKAVMERNYPLAKKLCQMILIYEPEKPEAKHFLLLIEEKLLAEEAQEEGSSNEDNKSDNEEEADSVDEDDGDDEDSESSDSDEEFSDSSSSDGREEDFSQY